MLPDCEHVYAFSFVLAQITAVWFRAPVFSAYHQYLSQNILSVSNILNASVAFGVTNLSIYYYYFQFC